MTRKIFTSTLSVAVIVLLSCLLVVTNVMYSYFVDMQREQLKDELNYAAAAVEALGQRYFDDPASGSSRLTWIAEDGTVLYDSSTDPANMENHADRTEVRDALQYGTGSSVRYSATMTERTTYEAVRLSDGSVLRISITHISAAGLMISMAHAVILITIAAIVLSAWLSDRMARRIVAPLTHLNLQEPLENETYHELYPLLQRIHSQQLTLQEQLTTLHQKQAEFDLITDNMKEALVLLDQKGRIVSINPAALDLFGAERSCIGADFMAVDRGREMRDALRDAHQKGHTTFIASVSGRIYRFDLNRIDAEGSVCGLAILGYDVTEQTEAERSRQEFTANVSHELKTPLQSIIGSAELIETGLVKQEDLPRFVGHIHKEASRLVTLIEDIIRLSQLDEGVDMPQDNLSLRSIAEEVCEVLTDTADTAGVTLSIAGSSGQIRGVSRLMFEVVYNLCENAIKYNRPGGSVQIRIEESDSKVRLTVEDNGIGIAPEHHAKIFERFYRVDKSHSKQSGGTGLGLSIVKHAVAYHHGTIDIRSAPGKGTAITVTFDKEPTP